MLRSMPRVCSWFVLRSASTVSLFGVAVPIVALGAIVYLGAIGERLAIGDDFIPRTQSKPPGPPLSPQQALERMVVPEGFHVELVASEPDLQNPVAMAFDDAGRIYVTESFEYPRREPGPGRDRIKVLEDTDGDGRVDKVTVFAEGLNIPSGIAVGHGGVWVANAPDLLFLEDTDGDFVSDRSTVVATGFGRDDTHELPNALTWGPDGYLYGLNGVFNRSVVKQGDRVFDFTCALFRIHPRTREFELFCEGTSNPWGVAFDTEGSAFVSACVIDHLWHLTESAYYVRQGGPYPPHTWWAESIVEHKHQMAAYCGIEYFDSDAYPVEYRNKLYMGNIHGGCINVDRIERAGATYRGSGEPDFMTANDVWFMPVAQKVGPDGCLYVLDWYDRYHCYQDASADPQGVDRGHGRLYRIVYKERPKPRYADVSQLKDLELIHALKDENIFVRQRAQLELAERQIHNHEWLSANLETIALSTERMTYRMHAIWALAGSGPMRVEFLRKLAESDTPEIRAWGVRLIGDHQPGHSELAKVVQSTAKDSDPRVRVQAAIAGPKMAGRGLTPQAAVELQLSVLKHSEDDPILPRVVWRNLIPSADAHRSVIESELLANVERPRDLLRDMAPRLGLRWASGVSKTLEDESSRDSVRGLLQVASRLAKKHPQAAAALIQPLATRVRNRELELNVMQSLYGAFLAQLSDDQVENASAREPWSLQLLIAGLIQGDPRIVESVVPMINDRSLEPAVRAQLLRFAALHPSTAASSGLSEILKDLVSGMPVDRGYRDTALDLGIANASEGDLRRLIEALPQLQSEVQASIAERMGQREPSATALLELIVAGKLRKELLSPNRVRLLATSGSEPAKRLVSRIWGTVNVESSREREEVLRRVGDQLRWDARGNAERGWLVYDRICGQCHVMHGRGVEVGPNITANGRGSHEQLLVSVFNPSLVIGEAYQSVTVRTDDGTVITGLLVARDDSKTVIKTQGGKEVTIAAEDVEIFQQDKKSLMPEGIESQLSSQELADLFALLTLEKAPGTTDNSTISGTPGSLHQSK